MRYYLLIIVIIFSSSQTNCMRNPFGASKDSKLKTITDHPKSWLPISVRLFEPSLPAGYLTPNSQLGATLSEWKVGRTEQHNPVKLLNKLRALLK